MARIKIMDGGDRARVLDYLSPITGVQAFTSGTATVTLATIAAGDIVLAQLLSSSTTGLGTRDLNTVITAGTGFVVTTQVAGNGTLVYAVFHPNA